MPKRFVFEVAIEEGSDEFWESSPTEDDVKECLISALEQYGFEVARPGGYIGADTTVRFVKCSEVPYVGQSDEGLS